MGGAQDRPTNGESSRSLPDHASTENLKKQAKHLLKLLKSGDADSVERVKQGLPRLADTPTDQVGDAGVTLQEVQHVLAVEYGYACWTDLVDAARQDEDLPRRGAIRSWRRSLMGYEEEAGYICRAVAQGGHWAIDQARRHLPRLAELEDDEIRASGVTPDEARQVVAMAAGFGTFDELAAEVRKLRPVRGIEDLANLDDDETREIIWRVGRDDLSIAMKAVSDHFKERFRANMSASEWQALNEQTEELGPMLLTRVEEVQHQIAQKFRSDHDMV